MRGIEVTPGRWGYFNSTMVSSELCVSLTKGDDRQGIRRTKSNLHVYSSDGAGQKATCYVNTSRTSKDRGEGWPQRQACYFLTAKLQRNGGNGEL